MVLMAIVPKAPAFDSEEPAMIHYKRCIKDLGNELGLSKKMKEEAFELGRKKRKFFDEAKLVLFQFVQTHKRKSPSHKRVNAETKAKFHSWRFNDCPLVIASPCKRDSILVPKEDGSDEKVRVPNFYYGFSQREIYDVACKHPSALR